MKTNVGGRWRAGRGGVWAAWALLAGLCLLLLGCGGGTTAERSFKPNHVIVFGDENSIVLPDGRKYGVNALNSDNTLDCKSNPNWVQSVASAFNFIFAECNPEFATSTQALMRAVVGAKADDVKTQIDLQVATGGGVGAGDLVTIYAGVNDVIELYNQFGILAEADLTGELRARGERLAAQVNRLVGLGAKVIIATVPDMGLTPFAFAEQASKTDVDRAALLTRLSAAFNGRIRTNILNDGRFIGLVLTDEMVQSMSVAPTAFGLSDVTNELCTAVLPNCTTNTLKEGATATTWLWADATRLAQAGQTRLGSLAATRALNNPF